MGHKLIITTFFYSILFFLLTGCERTPPQTPSGDGSQAPAPAMQDAKEQSAAPQSQTGQAGTEQPKQNLDLTLEHYPADGAENLFAGEDKAEYDFFQSREKDASVKLKGKLYLKEEVAPAQRLENLDGGEVEVRVPLK